MFFSGLPEIDPGDSRRSTPGIGEDNCVFMPAFQAESLVALPGNGQLKAQYDVTYKRVPPEERNQAEQWLGEAGHNFGFVLKYWSN